MYLFKRDEWLGTGIVKATWYVQNSIFGINLLFSHLVCIFFAELQPTMDTFFPAWCLRLDAFREDLLRALREASSDGGSDGGAHWDEAEGEGFLVRTLAFGPRNVGSNVLARWEAVLSVRFFCCCYFYASSLCLPLRL